MALEPLALMLGEICTVSQNLSSASLACSQIYLKHEGSNTMHIYVEVSLLPRTQWGSFPNKHV